VDALPENAPLTDEKSCDLYSLLAEFLSLKKQIQLQNREQSKQIRSIKGFNEFSNQGREILNRFEKQTNQLAEMVEKAGEAGRMETIKCFLGVRDPLVRGAASAKKARNGFFGVGRKKAENLIGGYEIALRKLDHALAMTDTFPIETEHRKFDPAVMTAVDTRPAGHGESGTVQNEISSGFIRKGKMIRPAQVIVNK
jgi:molecular chaperone GrpE (heat shock protein)